VARGRQGYELRIENGRRATDLDPVQFARRMEELGAGEIVINSIDRDGTMQGYDIDLLKLVRGAVTVPMSALGGAGSLEHLRQLIREFGIIGAAAGSLFVFKGVYRAVLINYPKRAELDALVAEELRGLRP
jgi:cyclase